METQYKIMGIYYTKPRVILDAEGEAIATRYGIFINVGMAADCNGMGVKKVEAIEWDEELNSFKIIFTKKGMLVIPRRDDTEVYYE